MQHVVRRLIRSLRVPADSPTRMPPSRHGGFVPLRGAEASSWYTGWLRDFRHALRGLIRRPALTAVTLTILTLGVGGNAAVFTLAWQTTFRPLQYPNPERLVRIFETNASSGQALSDVSSLSLVEWAKRTSAFTALGFFGRSVVIFPGDDNRVPARYQSVSPGALAALGVRPILGRIVLKDEERQPDEVLISHEYWQRRFGGDPKVIDRLHHFEDVRKIPERIIGVMPPGFVVVEPADIWAINVIRPSLNRRIRSARSERVLGRLRDGVTLEQASADLARISNELAKTYPDSHDGWSPVLRPLHDTTVADFRLLAVLLSAGATVVLLLTCTNVGGLLLMDAASRGYEVQLRRALGASTWRVWRLWASEGLIMAGAALLAGTLSSYWFLLGLTSLAPATAPRLGDVSPSGVGALVAMVCAVCILGLYGLTPVLARVLATADGTVQSRLERRALAGRRRTRATLIAVQTSLAVVLVVGAVFLGASLRELYAEPLGFEPGGVTAIRLAPNFGDAPPLSDAADFGRQLEELLPEAPGIMAAAISTAIPLDDGAVPTLVRIQGDPSERSWPVIEHSASPGFRDTLGISLLEGRWFDDSDLFDSRQLMSLLSPRRAEQTAVVTAATAKAIWPGGSALGQRLVSDAGGNQIRRIVGVIEDLKFVSPREVPSLRLFVPWAQRPIPGSMVALLKGENGSVGLSPEVRRLIEELRPGMGVYPPVTLEELRRSRTADARFAAALAGGFALLAVALMSMAVFGAVGSSIISRREELAVRLALGAPRASLAVSVARSAAAPVLTGALVGVAVAALAARGLQGLLFGIGVSSPAPYLTAIGATLLVTAVASALPLRRLLAIDPAASLRVQ